MYIYICIYRSPCDFVTSMKYLPHILSIYPVSFEILSIGSGRGGEGRVG